MLRLLLVCVWILMIAVVAFADRSGDVDSGAFNLLGLLKLGSRMAPLGIGAFVLWSSRERILQSSFFSLLLPWSLFTAWAVVSLGWSALPSVSIGQSLSVVILLMLSGCIAVHTRRIADVSQVLKHLCLAMLLISAVVLAAKFVAPDMLSLRRDGKGVFHATNAAATAGLGIVLVSASRFLFGWRWSRWLFAPSLLLHSATLALANNRASLLFTAIVVVLCMLWAASPHGRWMLITCLCLALAAYIVADPAFRAATGLNDRLAEYMARDQSPQELAALSGREEMWTVIWDSFLQSPWIGHGYFVSSESGKVKVWYQWANWTAHNFWLQILVSTGMIGAGLMAWALSSYVVRLAQVWRMPSGSQRAAGLGALALVWQCGWGLTNESFVGPLQAESIAFFAVLGLVLGRIVTADARAHDRSLLAVLPSRRPISVAVLATGSS